MRRTACLIIVLFVTAFMSCSKSVKDEKDSYVIRYVSLSKVFDYAVKNDPEAALLKNKIKSSAVKKREAFDDYNGVPQSDDEEISNAASEEEKKVKTKIYGRIKTSVSSVARKCNADFILNTGDAVIFSKPAYDVTGDVILEYKKIQDISSPSIK